MKLEIYKPSKKDESVYLRLRKDDRGNIDVAACTCDGGIQSYLLTFTAEGVVSLINQIEDGLGFQVDDMGRIKVAK